MSFRIKQLRNEANMSQADLAKKLNLARSTISMWETNAATPDADTIKKLSSLFNVSIDFLMGTSDISSVNDSSLVVGRINALLKEQRKNLSTLSSISNVPEEYLINLLQHGKDDDTKSIDYLYAIANGLDTTVEYLTTGDERYKTRENFKDIKYLYLKIAQDMQARGISPDDLNKVLDIVESLQKK